ncbi:hypothetical protein L6164_021256 [Bauhinia variegata]|uniref:Uncharacterized protein n=1 Tax=Bauhinia variegata TaxID=167791 RepID=A0ACB9MZN8_BAUVA|nr:hypothetical protein L6164_021256 [Bauhinia variegata]
MEICPACGTMLLYELPDMGRPSRFYCPTCPYVCYIESGVKIKRRQHLVRKDIEPVISPDDTKYAQTTEVIMENNEGQQERRSKLWSIT